MDLKQLKKLLGSLSLAACTGELADIKNECRWTSNGKDLCRAMNAFLTDLKNRLTNKITLSDFTDVERS